MLQRRDGATAIVRFGRRTSLGHAINVINIDGEVYFIDALHGRAVPATGDDNFNAFLDVFDADGTNNIPNNGDIWLISTQ